MTRPTAHFVRKGAELVRAGGNYVYARNVWQSLDFSGWAKTGESDVDLGAAVSAMQSAGWVVGTIQALSEHQLTPKYTTIAAIERHDMSRAYTQWFNGGVEPETIDVRGETVKSLVVPIINWRETSDEWRIGWYTSDTAEPETTWATLIALPGTTGIANGRVRFPLNMVLSRYFFIFYSLATYSDPGVADINVVWPTGIYTWAF